MDDKQMVTEIERLVCQLKKKLVNDLLTEIKTSGIVSPDDYCKLNEICKSYTALSMDSDKHSTCEAYTAKGSLCTRKRLDGLKYCGTHAKKYSKEVQMQRLADSVRDITLMDGNNSESKETILVEMGNSDDPTTVALI